MDNLDGIVIRDNSDVMIITVTFSFCQSSVTLPYTYSASIKAYFLTTTSYQSMIFVLMIVFNDLCHTFLYH